VGRKKMENENIKKTKIGFEIKVKKKRGKWDNTPLFVKYNPGIPDLLDLFVLDLFTNE
jgi:hypothetical protein